MPKKNPPARKPTGKVKSRLQQILEQANTLDRRRQAQIANQVAAINRLLKDGEYDEEMRILHEGAAVLAVENQDLRAALRELVRAVDATVHIDNDRAGDALDQARALIAVSAPVSEQDGAVG
jgi:hypothetical protein